MNSIGGQEMLLTVLQNPELWRRSDRWDDKKVDNWFKTKLKNDTELGMGFTHEEPLTSLMKNYINSYKDLPKFPYQIQTKFRNETRAKSGIMRCREFLMKDLYSFHANAGDLKKYYQKASESYLKIFKKCGIDVYKTLASGGSFAPYSHEYQMPTEAGEDIIYICKCGAAINKEIIDREKKCPECGGTKFEQKKAVEVGNIFELNEKYYFAI